MSIISQLNRYIYRQLIILFLFAVCLLSAVGVAIGTLSELAYQIDNYDLPLKVAVKIFIYKIPEYVAYGLPIATLLTTLIVYGRLSRESEIIAFKSVGISLYKVILPAIYLSVMIALVTFMSNQIIVPQANFRVNNLRSLYLPETELSLHKKDIFYPEYEFEADSKKIKRLYYAKRFNGKKFINLVILSWDKDSLQQIITAQNASWKPQPKLWMMEQVTIDNLSNDILTTARKSFNNYQIALPATLFLVAKQYRDPSAMSLFEAKNYLQLIKNSGDAKKIRLFKVRIQQKLAFPFICLIFALIGATVGTTFNNLNRGKSFGFCVGISFGYYLLGFMIGSLGIAGLINPIIAAWLPNVIGLIYGFWLLKLANCSV